MRRSIVAIPRENLADALGIPATVLAICYDQQTDSLQITVEGSEIPGDQNFRPGHHLYRFWIEEFKARVELMRIEEESQAGVGAA